MLLLIVHTELLPFSRRLQSSLSWRTICGLWCRWLRSSGCHNVLSSPPAAGFLADLSNLSWSGRGIAPANADKVVFFSYPHSETYQNTWCRYATDHVSSPSQTQSSRRSESADLQRMEGSQLPFHRWGLPGPTSPPLCCNPKRIQLEAVWDSNYQTMQITLMIGTVTFKEWIYLQKYTKPIIRKL